jgi:hypothetical protein
MVGFRGLVLLAASIAVALLVCGIALAAKTYPDRLGDVKGGSGPDIASITVSNTPTMITFRVRFARTPPLRVSTQGRWVDMLLIGIDVPPIGPLPVSGVAWRGANYALGTHGPSTTGRLADLTKTPSRRPTSFKVVTRGATVTLAIPRRVVGNPSRFTFQVAAGREYVQGATGGGGDLAPAYGTFRFALT